MAFFALAAHNPASAVVSGWKYIDNGENGSCGISTDDTLYCWGEAGGRLGSPITNYIPVTEPRAVDVSGVLAGKLITQVSTGIHACAIADGQAYCWGSNTNGQLGIGSADTLDAYMPVAVSTTGVLSGKTITDISAGRGFTCVVADGGAYCWGNNAAGQLGDGTATQSVLPIAVDTSGVLGGKIVTRVVAGESHACAIADGQAYCWGRNFYGELGNGTASWAYGPSSPVAVDTSGVLGGKTVTDIALGYYHTCAVADGQAYCWGSDTEGKLGAYESPIVSQSEVPVEVDVSGVLSGKTVTDIAAGTSHTCAVADGQAYCWGSGQWGQLGIGTESGSRVPIAVDTSDALLGKTVVSISTHAPTNSTCAIADGQAYCWGDNGSGQVGVLVLTPEFLSPMRVGFAPVVEDTAITSLDYSEVDGKTILNIRGTNFPTDINTIASRLFADGAVVILNGVSLPFCSPGEEVALDLIDNGMPPEKISDTAPCFNWFNSDMDIVITENLITVWVPSDFDRNQDISLGVYGTVDGVLGMATFNASNPLVPSSPNTLPEGELANTGMDTAGVVATAFGVMLLSSIGLYYLRRN